MLLALGGLVDPADALRRVLARRWRSDDLYQATIAYNVQYSGETYAGPLDMARYLVRFPIEHARVDALWFLGGLGLPWSCWRQGTGAARHWMSARMGGASPACRS